MTSNNSRPPTCGAQSVEGDKAEQKQRVAWAWKRREDALKGGRKSMGDRMVVEYIEGEDTD